jgi:hypothetical protein
MLSHVGDVFTARVDLNSCHCEDDEICPWAQAILDRLDAPSEVSPSRRGVHALFAIRRLEWKAREALVAGSDQ